MLHTQVELPNEIMLPIGTPGTTFPHGTSLSALSLAKLNDTLAMLGVPYKYEAQYAPPERNAATIDGEYNFVLVKNGPFSVKWSNEKTFVCQTPFVFKTLQEARLAAQNGPTFVKAKGIEVWSISTDEYIHAIRYGTIVTGETEVGNKLLPVITLSHMDAF